MRGSLRAASVAFCAFLGFPEGVRAAHPFITDDSNTQGTGHFELQLGTQYSRTAAGGVTLDSFQFAPQLTYGMAGPVDLILRPTYDVNVTRGSDSVRNSGWGDTNLEVKWRFWQGDPWSLAARVGTGFPSGNFGRGLDSGRSTPRAYLQGGYHSTSLEVWANVGTIRGADDPSARAWLGHVSADGIWTVRNGLKLGLDLAADQNPLRASRQWPTIALIGAIVTVASWDLDVGYQRGLNRSAPTNEVLLGATLRW
jgi:hypothetical protein